MTEELKAARALLKISKMAQNQSRSLGPVHCGAVPEQWRGLVHGERVGGPDGTKALPRLLVHFLDDLGRAVRLTVESGTGCLLPDVLHADALKDVPPWARRLIEASHVWHAPSYGNAVVTPDRELAQQFEPKLGRTLGAPANRFHKYSNLPLPPVPAGRDLRAIANDLEAAMSDPDRGVAFRTASDGEHRRARAYELVIAAAMDRYPNADRRTTPVVYLLAHQIRHRQLPDLGFCSRPTCPQEPNRAPSCTCWTSFCDAYGVNPDDRRLPGNPSREMPKGLIAVDIAAWQLCHAHTVGDPRRRHLTAPPASPMSVPDADLSEWVALGPLLALQQARFQVVGRFTDDDIRMVTDAAMALDQIFDPSKLRIGVSIASAALGAATLLDGASVGPELALALAHLTRTTAGGYRELRQPAQVDGLLGATNRWLAEHKCDLAELRLLEAAQDLQLAWQRRNAWQLANRAFAEADEAVQLRLGTVGRGDVAAAAWQKALEVAEQLALGRLGGLLQQAEQLLRNDDFAPADELFRAADTIRRKVDGRLASLEDFVAAGGAVTDVPAFLRSNARWRAMPAIMGYRRAVGAALVALASRAGSEELARRMGDARRAAGEVEQLRKDLADGPAPFTERQAWEYHRTRFVHALFDRDIEFEDAVKAVVNGGDDGKGDYVLPMLRWAPTVTAISSWFGPDELHDAFERIARVPLRGLRLPDLQAFADP